MIVSEKPHKNLSDYIQFLFKKDFNLLKKGLFLVKKIRNSVNYIYEYAHWFFGKDF